VLENGKSIDLNHFLEQNKLKQGNCGLSKIPHMKDCFNLFHSSVIQYKGIVKSELSNDVALSTIPKGEEAISMLFFNKDGYSTYCKKHKEYWEWVEKRNEIRYSATKKHGKNYDSKNMMHTFRLLYMAKEIALGEGVNVKRSDRDYLLDIKNGKFEYGELVSLAEKLKAELSDLYKKSTLPDLPDLGKINELLIEIRQSFYHQSYKNCI